MSIDKIDLGYYKIAVLNNSGNVGKTTFCVNVLKPRISNAEVIRIESSNYSDGEAQTLSANEFLEIFDKINTLDTVIIDIGSSNIEMFMNKIKEHSGSHDDINLFIIPTTPEHKQQLDTVSTVNSLLNIGVPPENIRLVLNFHSDLVKIEKEFSTLIENNTLDDLSLGINELPVLKKTNVFQLLHEEQKDIESIIDDETDYQSLIRQSKDATERSNLNALKMLKRLVMSTVKEHDECFEKLKIGE